MLPVPISDEKEFSEFLKVSDIKDNSKSSYLKGLKSFYQFIKDNSIKSMDYSTILEFKNFLKLNKTSATINLYLSAVRCFFNYIEQKTGQRNVAKFVKSEKRSEGFLKSYLNMSQISSIISSLDRESPEGKRDYAIFSLMLKTGLRISEVCNANIIDFQDNGADAILYILGKGQTEKNQFVIIPSNCRDAINDYLSTRDILSPDEPLFIAYSNFNSGSRLQSAGCRKMLNKYFNATGIKTKKISPHSLRHTAITLSLLGGATIQEAQAMARHSDINTTMIYSHNIDRYKNSAERKVEEILNF